MAPLLCIHKSFLYDNESKARGGGGVSIDYWLVSKHQGQESIYYKRALNRHTYLISYIFVKWKTELYEHT